MTLTNCANFNPAVPSFKKSSRIVINSEAGRRIIVLVATSEGMVALGCPLVVVQLSCGAYLLLPAGPAVVVVDGYALFGLPPAQQAVWRCRGSSALISWPRTIVARRRLTPPP